MNRLGELLTCAVIGVTAAYVIVWTADAPPPPPAPEPTPVTGQAPGGHALEELDESDPGWNCLTDGNMTCGPEWLPLTTGQRQAIVIAHDGLDDWQGCLTDAVTVVCPDTYVYEWVAVPADLAA